MTCEDLQMVTFLGYLILLTSLPFASGLCSTCLEERCYDNGECIIGCVPGYFGEYCDEACPSGCLNRACHFDIKDGTVTCTDGCIQGYCDIQCAVHCPRNCSTCDRQCNSCNMTLCPDRRYGADCSEICSPRYGKCDPETGQCIICRRGFYGDECRQECTACFTRADTIRDTCLSGCDICQSKGKCPTGSHGDACEVPCSPGCDKPERGCNRATGECSTGCVSGYHGLTCNYTCSEHCLSGRCDRATGECSTGCVSGYHGLICNYTCSKHCQSGICNRATGECPIGCVSGYHGLTCNNTCSRFCVGGVCNQHDGVCTSGCISGYKANFNVCEPIGSNKAVAIAVPIILICLVAVMVTAAVIWRRRRYRRSNTAETDPVGDGPESVPMLPHESSPTQALAGPESVPMLPHESSPTQALAARTKDEIDFITAGMIRVSAVDIVLDKLREGQRWITITGNAGDGKTVLGYLVLKEFLQKKVNVFTLYKPEEYDQIENIQEDRVIMFDDRFGAFLADQQLIKCWTYAIKRLLSFNQKNQQNKSVIFISRKNVVNESRVYLGHFTDQMFDPKCIVDLSVRKVTEERLNILEYHLQLENVTVKHELKMKVADKDIAHGFPHCCKMYSKLRSNGFDVDIEEFFESPLKFLDMTTKVLYKDNCKDLFQLLVKNDGEFDVYTVTDEDKRQELLQVEKEQEGSYITVWKNGTCTFAHPSVYESVLNVINDIDPLYCVQHATLSVIRQKMIISTSDEEDKSRAPCYIIVRPIPAVLKALAERFREEILKGDYSVFKHRLCQSREFCEALVSSCVNTNEQKQFINQPGKDEQTMLWTALKRGNMVAVQTLVREAGADVEMQDFCQLMNIPLFSVSGGDDDDGDGERGRTPLQYLCQLRNSPAAAASASSDDKQHYRHMETIRVIITEGKGDVNIRDQYGQTPLHYICQLKTNTEDQHRIHMETIRVIITEGRGDVNIRDQYGQTILHYICQLKTITEDQHRLHMDTIRVITEGRGDVNIRNQFGQTALHYLFKCQTLTLEDIKCIITDAKGDLNQCEQYKSTPLHYLCAFSGLQLDTVDLVINEGKGDFNTGDEHGTTPFHYLSRNDNVQFDVVLRIVNTAKGDLNKQDENGITPLHVLCKGSLQVRDVLTLINKGDKADMYGNTPLHFLCSRRRISDDEVQQLKQLPESKIKKQNKLGYTPLDYLINQDGSPPWSDGMIARSAADLVLCRVKHGDTSTLVLGLAMILNSQKVHGDLQVEDFGRELNNMARSGERNTPGQFKEFRGTCSSPLPLPPVPSPLTSPSYWETQSTLRWREGGVTLLEMGVKEGESNMDKKYCVSYLPGGVCVSVLECHCHPGQLCIRVERRDQEEWLGGHQVGECVSLPLPTSGEEVTFTFGLVLDVRRGRVAFLDVGRGKLLCKLNLKFTQQVFPMFCVTPYNDRCATRMRLVSGREISVTDQKIQLIQQALSD